MSSRRRFLVLAALGAALPSWAQTGRKATIALLMTGNSEGDDVFSAGFVAAMRGRGWVEGKNVTYQRFYTRASRERADELARQAAKGGPDLIFTPTGGGVMAARKATTTIPIVFVMVSDPVASGYVQSLRQPGQNATGVFQMGADVISKRMELIHEALPRARRVGVLLDRGAADYRFQKREHEQSPRPKSLSVVPAEVADFTEVPDALDRLRKDGASVLVLSPSFTFTSHKLELMRLALERKLSPVAYRSDWAEAGALMSYGASVSEVNQLSAGIADRILNGGRAADTPVERASKFELVVNQRSAKALGIALPKAILQRADRILP